MSEKSVLFNSVKKRCGWQESHSGCSRGYGFLVSVCLVTPKWATVVVFGLFGVVLQCLVEHVLLGLLTVAVAGSAAGVEMTVEEVDGFSKSSLFSKCLSTPPLSFASQVRGKQV